MKRIQILIFAVNPQDTDRLRLDQEIRDIEDGIDRSKYNEQFLVKTKLAVRIRDLRRDIMKYEPDIVHFSGHGSREGLVLEDNSGNSVLVSADALSDLFKEFKHHVECVVLNACYSESQAEAIHQHIDYVVGMNSSVSDKAAIEFSVGFYDALGAMKSYKKAFDFGRNAVQSISESDSLIPVLLRKEHHLNLPDKIMQELAFNFTSKIMKLIGKRQRSLLEVIERLLSLSSSEMISYDEIKDNCDDYLNQGLYYRLEQLRLLGFIEKEQTDVKNMVPIYSYFLSTEYRDELFRSS